MSEQKIDKLKELDEQGEYPQRWAPEVGDSITGVIRRYSEVTLEKSGLTLLCVVEEDDTEVKTIFCGSTVLKGEFVRLRPKIGERIFVRYLGTPAGKSYQKYVVRVLSRDEEPEPNWTKFGGEEEVDHLAKTPYPDVPLKGSAAPASDPNDPFADDLEGTPYAHKMIRR